MFDNTMTRSTQDRHAAGRDGWGHLAAVIRRVWRTATTRRSLPELTQQQLADIGITRATALAEAARLPWDTSRRTWRNRVTTGSFRQRYLASAPRASGLYEFG